MFIAYSDEEYAFPVFSLIFSGGIGKDSGVASDSSGNEVGCWLFFFLGICIDESSFSLVILGVDS